MILEYSHIFKVLIVIFLSGFILVTLISFLLVRQAKKEAEFARNRVAEQYAARDFRLPVLFACLITIMGFVSLLFGANLVVENKGKINYLL